MDKWEQLENDHNKNYDPLEDFTCADCGLPLSDHSCGDDE